MTRYPESVAGGYTRVDGTVAFFQRVHALLDEVEGPATVVDFGAGRGAYADHPVRIHRTITDLRGTDRRVIGVDVDPVVTTNARVDEAHVIPPSGPVPLADASVDVVVSQWTWEHVDDPAGVAAELGRITKPGGWICAMTPNRWGYIALAARMVPNRLHVRVLRRFQPRKAEHDTFPTRYRLNTKRAIRSHFPADRYEVVAYVHESEPGLYAGRSRVLTGLIGLLRHLPEPLGSVWYVYIRKRP